MVSLSSVEAKYCACYHVIVELTWFKSLLSEPRHDLKNSMMLFYNNTMLIFYIVKGWIN